VTMGAVSETLFEEAMSNSAIPRYEIAEWREKHGVLVGVTGRLEDFDLGLAGSDSMGVVMSRLRSLRQSFGPSFSSLVVGHQSHGTGIGVYPYPIAGLLITEDCDGHATALGGMVLGVTVADCVPVYLLDPQSPAIAILHAGWRGVAGGMLECGVRCLSELTGVAPSGLLMHCGVGICGECYEVGSEVFAAVTGRPAEGPSRLDLRSVLIDRARALGLVHTTASGWCSAHDGDRFYSHRASRGRAGRMLAYIGRPVT
jgi:copper oxidase (laccase) domain-containing protein